MADPRDLAERDPAHGAAAATAVGWQRGWAAGYAADREAAADPVLAVLAAREAQGCTYVRIADVRQALVGEGRQTAEVDRAQSERDAYEAGMAAGREAAAQAVLDWAAAHVAWDDGLTAQLAEIARGGR